jgi:hypothetical protein
VSSRLGIAAQALAVAALATVVYLAFLQPNDTGSLSGIDVESEGRAPTVEVSGSHRREAEPGAGSPEAGAGASTAVTGLATPTAPTLAVNEDSPADSQYAGTVTRILARVRAAD